MACLKKLCICYVLPRKRLLSKLASYKLIPLSSYRLASEKLVPQFGQANWQDFILYSACSMHKGYCIGKGIS